MSVGSVYQYFPNKASILFRLQSEEWQQTSAMLETILQDKAVPPLVHAFVRSECEEAAVRMALVDAAPIYRDAPEAIEARAAGTQMFRGFIDEVLPNAPLAARTLAGDLVMATLTEVGREFSGTPRTEQEITCYARLGGHAVHLSGALSDRFFITPSNLPGNVSGMASVVSKLMNISMMLTKCFPKIRLWKR